MAEKTYWMRDIYGNRALVTDRDRWIPRGWADADEPTDREFVWMEKEDLEQPALIPWGARDYWQGIGFVSSTPPEPVNPTKDPVLTDVHEEPAAPAKKSAAKPAPKNEE